LIAAEALLELGSGGGSLAYHLKPHFQLTLTDISPAMLAVNSRQTVDRRPQTEDRRPKIADRLR
jgi:ubiquinone/menaquinone biosynthesis C-methylase UbiE